MPVTTRSAWLKRARELTAAGTSGFDPNASDNAPPQESPSRSREGDPLQKELRMYRARRKRLGAYIKAFRLKFEQVFRLCRLEGTIRVLDELIAEVTVDDDIFRWEATLIGPVNTPYEGGVFKISLNFPPDFPNNPPKVCFITRICHPNVLDNGGIYLRVLRADYWHPMSIVKLFKGLVEKLIEPEVNDEEQTIEYLANLYKSDRRRFEAMAREMTNQYAGRGN
ncbi:PREDICTED: ubiquitin-conjugating enzyme E2 4-like [Camelina sativa]|uniref:Ubiquitin-conjugating enzyme E2 4-like n=1 Tax=Camelina sativa TaxID=90675 RepID=A0ABM0WR10_CAMSA|nr:PREDICTED: ubiquitin-conjugating enzyme E2 4-like [Camelina sativa]